MTRFEAARTAAPAMAVDQPPDRWADDSRQQQRCGKQPEEHAARQVQRCGDRRAEYSRHVIARRPGDRLGGAECRDDSNSPGHQPPLLTAKCSLRPRRCWPLGAPVRERSLAGSWTGSATRSSPASIQRSQLPSQGSVRGRPRQRAASPRKSRASLKARKSGGQGPSADRAGVKDAKSALSLLHCHKVGHVP